PPPPRRDPRRDQTRPQQRAPGRPQQPHPPDQPPQLRLPLSLTTDRARLPLLHRHPHPPPQVILTPNRTGAPHSPRRIRRTGPARRCSFPWSCSRPRRCGIAECASRKPLGSTGGGPIASRIHAWCVVREGSTCLACQDQPARRELARELIEAFPAVDTR